MSIPFASSTVAGLERNKNTLEFRSRPPHKVCDTEHVMVWISAILPPAHVGTVIDSRLKD